MAAPFHFEQSLAFEPGRATAILRAIPAHPGVFTLRAPHAEDPAQPEPQPYLTRAADLRRRITRILAPPDSQSKRLNLRDRVAHIDYTVTGSEFESTLTLYHAAAAIFGLAEARRRLRLHTPYFLRFTAENAYPRVYSTNRLSKRALANTYGPFPSRAAADRYCEAVLDLFKLRRCYEDLAPAPDHPGCVYGEMNKCLAPCNQAHTPEGAATYSAEAAAVKRFFDTRGESMIVDLGLEREEASAQMEFEKAATLHAQWHKVKAAQALADELVQPIPKLRAIIVQRSATAAKPGAPHLDSEMWDEAGESADGSRRLSSGPASQGNCHPDPSPAEGEGPASQENCHPDPEPAEGEKSVPENNCHPERSEGPASSPPTQPHTEAEPSAALFLLHAGCITGPELLSTLGVRAVKEQTSVGSSLFAQPLMLQAIPLEEPSHLGAPEPALSLSKGLASETWVRKPAQTPAESPELRAATVIASLEAQASTPTDLATLSDHLSLLRRWYYRPEKQRKGEVFFPDINSAAADAKPAWPIRRILNASARAALGDPTAMAETQRDLSQHNPNPLNSEDPEQTPTRTKILHPGRPGVERVVHVIDPPPSAPTFTSRRKPR